MTRDPAFEADLAGLREQLLLMGGRVERAIADAMRALTDRDAALAERVRTGDAEINRLELAVDEAARALLERWHPTGDDLRLVTTAFKIVVDLERMGDLAARIAGRGLELAAAPQLLPYVDLHAMADLAQGQLDRALGAFIAADPAGAQDVIHADQRLDELHARVQADLLALMARDHRHIHRGNALLAVGRHLERLGDHATNLAEMVVFVVRGTDIRHPRSRLD